MWFADKLGPVPKASPQGKAHSQTAAPAPGKAAKNAASQPAPQPKGQAQRAQPAAAPEPPKKKKGWF